MNWLVGAMTQPRRILHVISRLDGYGGARMLRHLAVSQAAAGQRTIVAALTAEAGPARELRQCGVAVHALSSRWALDPIALARLIQLRRKSQADVVHVWDMAGLAAAAISRRAGRGGSLVATLDASQTRNRWAARVIRFLHQRVDAFAVEDEPTRSWLGECGVAAQRIYVIPRGTPRAAPPSESRAEFRARWSLPLDAPLIAVAGPLRRHKHFDEAIWCFELVRVLYEHARLLVIGDGPDRARLESFADAVSESRCVRFLGYRDDVAELLPQIDVFWQLEAAAATPWALLEAQAAGVPAVASDVPAHRAAIVPDRTGYLAPLGNRAEVARATDDLINHPDKAKRLAAAAAVSVAENWSLDASLASYDRVYEQVAKCR